MDFSIWVDKDGVEHKVTEMRYGHIKSIITMINQSRFNAHWLILFGTEWHKALKAELTRRTAA